MTIQEIIDEAYEIAVKSGFSGQDIVRNQKEVLMLIISEIGEAQEAHRTGKKADLEAYEAGDIVYPEATEDEECRKAFVLHIKDSFEDELADVIIRIGNYLKEFEMVDDLIERGTMIGILDKLGQNIYNERLINIDVGEYLEKAKIVEKEPYNVGECLFDINKEISRSMEASDTIINTNPTDRMGVAIIGILRLAVLEGIDLQKHIEYKMMYNRTRPYLHDKNY